MEIRGIRMVQVLEGRDGRTYEISEAAGDVAAQLAELDPRLHVAYRERDEEFVIFTRDDDSGDRLVTTVPAAEWDQRVVARFERMANEVRNGTSIADRLDAQDAKVRAQREYEFEQAVGEKCYDLMRALQKLEGVDPRSFPIVGPRDAARRLIALHQAAPADDEPDDKPGELAEAREQARRGETVSLADAHRESPAA